MSTGRNGKKPPAKKAGGADKKPPKELREWESGYPDYPDLTCDEAVRDMEAVLDRLDQGDYIEEGADLVTAAVLHRFCKLVFSRSEVDQRTLEFLANRISVVLAGAHWDERFHLPGRELPATWHGMHPNDQRDLHLYCEVENRRRSGGKVTEIMNEVAKTEAASFETVRAAYYTWRARLNESLSNNRSDI